MEETPSVLEITWVQITTIVTLILMFICIVRNVDKDILVSYFLPLLVTSKLLFSATLCLNVILRLSSFLLIICIIANMVYLCIDLHKIIKYGKTRVHNKHELKKIKKA